MTLEASQLYAFMATSYRTGVLDKVLPIAGEALDCVMKERGLNLDDLLNKWDEVKEETLEKGDKILRRSAFLLRIANNDRMMHLLSRLLDNQTVRRVATSGMRKFLETAMAKSEGKEQPRFPEKLKGYLIAVRKRIPLRAGQDA